MNIGECFGEWQSVIGIPSRLTGVNMFEGRNWALKAIGLIVAALVLATILFVKITSAVRPMGEGPTVRAELPRDPTVPGDRKTKEGPAELANVIEDIRPKKAGRYGLIPRSVYIDDQGERVPVLFNPGQSDSRIILTVWT
jgi:hypothetical protein